MHKVLPLLFLALYFQSTKAAKVIGADIYFSTLKDKKVEVNLKRYRLLNDGDTQKVRIGVLIGNYITFGTATLISKDTFTSYCDTASQKDINGFGVLKEENFQVVFDFSSRYYDSLITKFCKIRFFYTDSSRWEKLTIIDGKKKFYIEASLDYCILQNDPVDPSFSNNRIFGNYGIFRNNCGFKCSSKTLDSFSFELVSYQDSIDRKLNYNLALNYRNPMPAFCLPPGKVDCLAKPNSSPPRGFYFDELVGDMIYSKSNCYPVAGVVVIRVNLFKIDSNNQMKNIGNITREMSLQEGKGISGGPIINSAKNSYTICEGDNICLSISTTEMDLNDTVNLSWDKTIPNAVFKIKDSSLREKEATFCWQTKPGDGRNAAYHFDIIAKNNACPFNMESAKGFQIFVQPNPYKIKKQYNFTTCNKLALKALNTGYKSIKWLVYNLSDTLIATASKFIDTIQLSLPYSSKYYVKSMLNDNSICYLTDTITNTKFDGNFHRTIDTGICQSNNVLDLNQFNLYKNSNANWYDEYDNLYTNKKIDISGFPFPIKLSAIYQLIPNANCKIADTFNFTIYDTLKKTFPDIFLCGDSPPVNLFSKGFYKRKAGYWQSSPSDVVDSLGYLHLSKWVATYNVKFVYDSSYCMNYEQLKIDSEKEIIVGFIADKTSGFPPLQVNFTNKTNSTNLRYGWDFGDKYSSRNYSVLENPTHNFDSVGIYPITLFASGSVCSDTLVKTAYIIVKAPLQQNSLIGLSDNTLTLFPNPGSGKINIISDKDFMLKVLNVSGKTILETENCKMLELPGGMYILEFRIEGSIEIRKLVVY